MSLVINPLIACVISLTLLGLHPSIQADAADRPNILFVFLDDFGWRDTGYMGSDFYETPCLDRLAKEGMTFTQAYACAANCAPSRACLLSGQYTPRHEIYNVGTGPRGQASHRRLQHIPGTKTLREDIPTWAHRLQDAGYKTATLGKWHLSQDPIPYGFDLNVGGTHAGSPPKGYYPPHGKAPGLENAPADEFITTTLCKRACEFIEKEKASSWFVYLSLFAVHTPIQAKKDLLSKYLSKEPGALHQNAKMATMIQAVDDGVSLIMDQIKTLDLDKKTAVVFFSDNGGYGPATDMHPLKGYKGTYYEGGIRVPFFIKWPGVVQAGSTNQTPIIGVDLYPTFLEMAGLKPSVDHVLDGVSLVPLLRGGTLAQRSLYWHFPAYLQSYGGSYVMEQQDPLFRSRPVGVIREGDWKLMEWFETGELELYHLKEDVGESTNLSHQFPAMTRRLHESMQAWRRETNAAIPSVANPSFDAEQEKAAIAAFSKNQ